LSIFADTSFKEFRPLGGQHGIILTLIHQKAIPLRSKNNFPPPSSSPGREGLRIWAQRNQSVNAKRITLRGYRGQDLVRNGMDRTSVLMRLPYRRANDRKHLEQNML
jgi:hypothetical protein